MKKTKIALLAILLIGLVAVVGSKISFNQKIASRSEKEQSEEGEIDYSKIKNFDNLKESSFFKKPMTRLEYVLERIEQKLNNESDLKMIKNRYQKYFEPYEHNQMKFDINIIGSAIYNPDKGRIMVSYNVDYVGSPIMSIEATCSQLIDEIQGILRNNSLLGVLVRDYGSTLEYEKTIENSFVYLVQVGTSDSYRKEFKSFTCLKESLDSEIIYSESK